MLGDEYEKKAQELELYRGHGRATKQGSETSMNTTDSGRGQKRSSVASMDFSSGGSYRAGIADKPLASQWVTPEGLNVTIVGEEIIFADDPDRSHGTVLSHVADEIVAITNGATLHAKLINELMIWSNGEVWHSRQHRHASASSVCCPSPTAPPQPEGEAEQPSGSAMTWASDSDPDYDGGCPQECTLQSRPKRMPKKSLSGKKIPSVEEEDDAVHDSPRPGNLSTEGRGCSLTRQAAARAAARGAMALANSEGSAGEAAAPQHLQSVTYFGSEGEARNRIAAHRSSKRASLAESMMIPEESRGPGFRVSTLFRNAGSWIRDAVQTYTSDVRSRDSDSRSSVGRGSSMDLQRPSSGFGMRNKAPESVLLKIVKSPWFEFFFTLAILGNAILIGVEIEYQATRPDQYVESSFSRCHMALSLTFVVELCLRVKAHGCRFFINEEWKWNVFDTVLVAHSIVDMVLDRVLGGSESMQRLSGQRALRVLRMVRNFRIVRMLRVFQELRMMLYAILGCFKALLWLVLLLVLLLYFFAVFFTQGTAEFLSANPDMAEDVSNPETDVSKLKDMYGSLAVSMFSLYKGMSNGVSWGELVVPLQKNLHWFYVVLILVFISFAIFAVLNVVTSVFVDSAMCQTAEEMEHKHAEAKRQARRQLIKMQQLFCEIDADESGYVSIAEFMEGLSDPSIVKCFELLGIETSEAEQLFHLLDPQDVGEVAIDEFVRGCTRLKGEAKSFDIACLLCEQRRLMYRFCHLEALVSHWTDPNLRNLPHSASRLARITESLVIESTTAKSAIIRTSLPERLESMPEVLPEGSYIRSEDDANAQFCNDKV